jgi:Short C-terminal domain
MPGLLRGVARTAVVAGTATAVSGRVSRRQQGRWAAKEQAAAPPAEEAPPDYAQQAPPAQGGNGGGGDMDAKLAQLKDLGELKAQGVLTDAEFEVQKDKILHG